MVELLQTSGFVGERRIKEATELRVLVNVIHHLCLELQTLVAYVDGFMVWFTGAAMAHYLEADSSHPESTSVRGESGWAVAATSRLS